MRRMVSILVLVMFLFQMLMVFSPVDMIQKSKASLTPSSGWSYYKQIDVSDSGGVSANYQMRLTVYSGSGTDDVANGKIYCNNYCTSFPDDIRFGTTSNPSNATQLPQWIEEYDSNSAIIWVKLPSDGSNTFYMFVGNSGASSASSGDDTFIFFDDFENAFGADWDSLPTPSSGAETQDVDTDGTYLYVGYGEGGTGDAHNQIYKVNLSDYTEVCHTTTEIPDDFDHLSGIIYHNGYIYALSSRSTGTDGYYIGRFNASDLSFVDKPIKNLSYIPTGGCFHDGYFWIPEWKDALTDTSNIYKYNTSWDLVETYTIPRGRIQGCYFSGDYLYITVLGHIGTIGSGRVEKYHISGTTFVLDKTVYPYYHHTSSISLEGLCIYDNYFYIVSGFDFKIQKIPFDNFDKDKEWKPVYEESGGIEREIKTINGNKVLRYSDGDMLNVPQDFTISDNFAVEMKGKFTTIDDLGILTKFSDNNNFYFSGLAQWHYKTSIGKRDGGDYSTLDSHGTDTDLATGVWYTLRATVVGSVKKFFLDDSETESVTNSDITGNKVGIRNWGTGAGYIDCFFIRKYASTEPSWSSFGSWTAVSSSNSAPSVNSPSPADGATDVSIQPICHIDISDADGDTMTIYWYENSTGSWILRQTNSSVGNGTYYWTFTQASDYDTTYYWKVAVNDSTDNTTAVYHFTTQASITSPTVVTNSSTDVEETNATLHGYLQDDGGENCTVWFEWGKTTGYGNATTNQTKSTGEEFNHTLGLSQQKLYPTGQHPIGTTLKPHPSVSSDEKYTLIDDVTPDENETYLYFDESDTSSFLIYVSNVPNYTIQSVVICVRGLNTDPTNNSGSWFYAKISNCGLDPPEQYVNTSYYSYYNFTAYVYNETNPLTADDINGNTIIIWLGNENSSYECRITQVYVVVEYNDTSLYLDPGTLYHYRAVANNSAGTSYGDDKMFLTKPYSPLEVHANPIDSSHINVSWVKGNGADKTVVIRKVGSCPENLTDGTVVYNGTGTSYIDSGLNPNTQYWYRLWSYVEASGLYRYSDEGYYDSATTESNNPPSQSNPNPSDGATDVDVTLSQLSIDVSDDDGDSFNWSIETSPDVGSASGNNEGNGTKTCTISGLQYSTTYTWYVNVTDGYDWNNQTYTFTTRSQYTPDPPAGFTATANGRFQIDLSWTKGSNADKTVIVFKTTGYPSTVSDGTTIYNDTGTSYSHTGLSQSTTYYYSAWSWNNTDNVYSSSYVTATDTTDSNNPPTISNPSPPNGSTNQPLSLTWSIDINDPDGDNIDWSIECSNGQNNSSTNDTNGSKSLSLSGLSYSTNYTVYVNVTDGYSWTNASYWFITASNSPPTQSNPSPANGATDVEITLSQLSIDISDPEGDTFNWTIETSPNIGSASGSNENNGTKTCSVSGLNYGTTYTWFVNVTDDYSWSNQTYSFTTRDAYTPANPSDFSATTDSRFQITLTWTDDSKADSTLVEYSLSSDATWNRGDHTQLYNGTAETYAHSGLSSDTTYYYKAWSYNATDNVWSSGTTTSNTTKSNNLPTLSNESPPNGSTNQNLSLTWSISIADADGDSFNWSIECSNGQSNSDTNDVNGTKTLSLSGLSYTTEYKVWVNATDGYDWTREWYTFTTREQYIPDPPSSFTATAVSSSQIDLSWTKGTNASTTYIERNTISSWDRGDGTLIYNDTSTSYSDTGLNAGTTYYYQAWSYNATDNVYSTINWIGLDFDGSNDDVRVPDDDSLNFTSSFSVDMALWVEDTPADGKYDAIISKMTDANTGWGIALYSEDGIWELQICVDGHNQSVGTASIPINKWVYPTVVFNNTTHTMHVYINGNEVYSYSEPNTASANTADLVIGECSYVGNDKTFDGKIDYIRVYNKTLTEQQIKYNFYWKDNNCTEDGLVSWWKFDENTGTTASDSWGSNDGTLEDGTAWTNGTKEIFSSDSEETQNAAPAISNPYPGNASTGVELQPVCHIQVNDSDGDRMTVYWYENTTSSWILRMKSTNVFNGTSYHQFTAFNGYNTTYWWKVAVNDSTDNTTAVYHFITRSQYVPDPPTGVNTVSGNNWINLTWTKGANNVSTTYVESNTVASWSRGAGTVVYNDTGTTYNDTGLSYYTHYYYQLWSYNSTDNVYSTTYASVDDWTLNPQPTISNPYPSNGTTSVNLQPTCHIDVSDPNGDSMNLYWYNSTDGTSFTLQQVNSSIGNGTYYWNYSMADTNNAVYYWKIAVNDSIDNVSAVYHFTTETSVGYPVVVTNDSTGVEETNATLWGYLSDDGNETCTIWFEYGTTTDYGNTTTKDMYIGSWSTFETGDSQPVDVTTDGNYIWVVDAFNAAVYKYSMDGVYTGEHWYTSGIGSNLPYGITTDGNYIWIIDLYDAEVYKFYMNGTYTSIHWDTNSWGNTAPEGITTDGNYIWIIDDADKVYKYDMDGNCISNWTSPFRIGYGITTDGNYIWITDNIDKEVYKFYMNGTYTSIHWNTTENSNPYGVTVYGNRFWVANPNADRIYEYIYNIVTTGEEFSYNLAGLSAGTLYHYRVAANNSKGTVYGNDKTFLTKPYEPYGLTISDYNNSHVTLGWSKGTGANKTIIRRSTVGYPSSPQSGTEVYNGTGTSFDDTTVTAGSKYYYSAWSYSSWSSLQQFSDNNVSVNVSLPPMPPQNISYILNVNGTTGNLTINWTKGIGADKTVISKSSSSYPTSPTSGVIYNGTGENYTDSNINQPYYYTLWSYNSTSGLYSNPVYLQWFAIWLNCYDEYSGEPINNWSVFISNDEGTETYTATNCANSQILNTSLCPHGENIAFKFTASGYKMRLYYTDIDEETLFVLNAYLPPAETPSEGGGETNDTNISTQLYLINVINVYDSAIENVKMTFKHYDPATENYVDTSVLYTDANGQVEIYLIPGDLYKVKLEKEGYQTKTEDYIPSLEIYTHTFRLYFEETTPSPENETVWDNITLVIYPSQTYWNTSITMGMNITSADGKLEWFNITVYRYNNLTEQWTLLHWGNQTTSTGGNLSYTTGNETGKYKMVWSFKKQNFSSYSSERIYYIYTKKINVEETFPPVVWMLITIFFALAATGFLIKFGAGDLSGLAGIVVMGIMFAIYPVTVAGVSCWLILFATALGYGIAMFLVRSRV